MLIMETVREIIDRLGGAASVARALGVGVSTVSEWKRSGSVPVRYWPGLIRYSGAAGVPVNAQVLMLAHAPAPSADMPAVCSTQHIAD